MLSRETRIFIVVALYLLTLFLVLMVIDRFILPSMTSGQATIRVPNVIGEPEDKARKQIQSRNLTFEIDKRLYSDKIPEGSIISQVPLPRSLVKEKRFVYVTVSKGRELVKVPYITGQSSRNAKLNLMKLGLEIGKIDYEFSDVVGKDTIIRQSISAGKNVPFGSQVNIIISKGAEFQLKVPMLIGLSEYEAVSLINESGLTLENIEYRQDNTYFSNVVIEQIPSPGTTATPQTIIKIVIAE